MTINIKYFLFFLLKYILVGKNLNNSKSILGLEMWFWIMLIFPDFKYCLVLMQKP